MAIWPRRKEQNQPEFRPTDHPRMIGAMADMELGYRLFCRAMEAGTIGEALQWIELAEIQLDRLARS